MTLRSRHTEKIQELKTAFLREKQDCQLVAEKKIAEMSKQASQVWLSLCVLTLDTYRGNSVTVIV